MSLWLCGLAAADAVALSCSALESSTQVANINEVRKGGDNSATSSLPDEFVELYMFASVSTSDWELCYFKNPTETCVSVPTTPFPFPYTTSLPTNSSTGEVILFDGDGGVLDHLRYDNTGSCSSHWSVPTGSSGCSSGCITAPSADKDVARLPDGTGSWGENDDDNTAGSSNSGGPHHIRILHDGAGLTCTTESITLQACADASCTSNYSGSVTTTAAPGGSAVTFTGTTTTTVRYTTVGTTALSVSGTTPAATSTYRCFVGTTETCSISFADSGLIFGVPGNTVGGVPDHVADIEQNITIAAVKKSDNALSCTPAWVGSKTVNFYSTFIDPGTAPPSGAASVKIGGTAIATATSGTPISLSFDSSGIASTTLQYADAGQMRVNATYTSSSGSDSGLTMLGNDLFIAKPKDFLIAVTGNPAATGPSGSVFKKAGEAFSMSITARNNSGVTTPNFGREASAEKVKLETTLVGPVGGNAIAIVPSSGTAIGLFSNGAVDRSDWKFDEVGIIALNPRLDDGAYLSYSGPADIVGTASGNIGRFIPARLGVSANVPVLQAGCAAGAFTYFGQPFGFATAPVLTVTGLNSSGALTLNYDDAYWKLTALLVNRSLSNTATTALTSTSVFTASGHTVQLAGTVPGYDGSATFSLMNTSFNYAMPSPAEAPFDANVAFAVTAADLTDLDAACYDPANLAVCMPFSIANIGGASMRLGRLALSNAFGPEVLPLQVPMQVQYFNGSAFLPHTLDTCTAITALALTDVDAGDALTADETCALDSGNPGHSGIGCGTAATSNAYTPTATGGSFTLWLKAPGAGNTGLLDLGLLDSSSLPAWLKFDWTGSGLTDPKARIGFGVFAGDQRQIYQREVYGQ